jgi:hypothetical protein
MSENQTVKPITTLTSGIIIGVGATMIVTGLLIAFGLNAIYAQQISYLVKYDIQVNPYAYGFDDLFFFIATGVFIAISGTYEFVLGCLNYFSAKVRQAYAIKNGVTLIGNALINGGLIGASIFSANLIRDMYKPIFSNWYVPVAIVFIIGSLIAITIGAFLIRHAYIHSQSATEGRIPSGYA